MHEIPDYRPWRILSSNKAVDGQAPPPRCAFIFDTLRKNYSHQSATGKLFHRSTNPYSRVQLKCDDTRWRPGGEVKVKLVNGVGSQYPSHFLGTWCIQHYHRWCAHLGCQQSTELTPPADLNGFVRFAERRNLVSARVPFTSQTQSTNKCRVLLRCISLLISCYMFLLNCHHQGANNYITKTYSNKMVLQFLRISKCTYYSCNLKYYKMLILNCYKIMVAFAVDNCLLASWFLVLQTYIAL